MARERQTIASVANPLRALDLPKVTRVLRTGLSSETPEIVRVRPSKPFFESERFEAGVIEGMELLNRLESCTILRINEAINQGVLQGITGLVTVSNIEAVSRELEKKLSPIIKEAAKRGKLSAFISLSLVVETFQKAALIANVDQGTDRILDYVGQLHGPVEDDALKLVGFVRRSAPVAMPALKVLGTARIGNSPLLKRSASAPLGIIIESAQTGASIPIAQEQSFGFDYVAYGNDDNVL